MGRCRAPRGPGGLGTRLDAKAVAAERGLGLAEDSWSAVLWEVGALRGRLGELASGLDGAAARWELARTVAELQGGKRRGRRRQPMP